MNGFRGSFFDGRIDRNSFYYADTSTSLSTSDADIEDFNGLGQRYETQSLASLLILNLALAFNTILS